MTAPTAKRATLQLAKPPAEAPARPVEPVSVQRLEHESAHQFAARSVSIAALEDRWMLHPQYRPTLRHSVKSDHWAPARADFLAGIAQAAAADRARNPAFIRAAGVRAALGE